MNVSISCFYGVELQKLDVEAGRMYFCHADTIVSKTYNQEINCALECLQITCPVCRGR